MLLHIIPNTANDKNHSDTGGTKGIKIFYEYFVDNNIEYEDLIAPNRSDKELMKILKSMDLKKFSHIFIHYTSFVGSLKFIKKTYPDIIVIVRSHNAEFPHWIHHSYSWFLSGNWIEALKIFLISFAKLRGDIISSRLADYILVITPWELENYWKLFPNKCNFLYVPYFSPQQTIQRNISDFSDRDLICTCLLSTNKSPFLIDAAKNFQMLVEKTEKDLPNWIFMISGNNDGIKRSKNKRVIFTGIVDDPIKLQRETRVVAVLSDFGFGFKTKILESIENGCLVLVSKKLFDRLPDAIKTGCIRVNIEQPKTFFQGLKKAELSYSKSEVNQFLKGVAFKNLNQAFIK